MLKWLGACATALLFAGVAGAQSQDDLLPVEQAFQVKTSLAEPGRIALRIDIAPDYYLYRGRIKAKTAQDGLELGTLDLPPGIPEHDEFQGDVEIYRGSVAASLPYTLAQATSSASVTLTVQGCHEVDPKICYPPHPTTFTLDLPASATPAAAAAGAAPPASGLVNLGGAGGLVQGSAPLPPEQAFVFEAIALSPTRVLARWSMPKGYYLYRDKSDVAIAQGDGVVLGAPQWPKGTDHTDEHFGTVPVYFGEVELPLDLARDNGAAQAITLHAEYQGCQDDGLCYPVLQKDVVVNLPPANAAELAAAKASLAAPAAAPRRAVADAAPTTAATAPASPAGLAFALLLALLGGVILNLMPCVLPVLSLKVLGLAQSGESAGTARRHALIYSAGVLVSFAAVGLAVVGLRAAGHALGWGFQLQQPLFVAVLVYVMFAIGLSLSGVFNLGAGLAGVGSGLASRSGAAGDFFTGVLAVVVASPCTVPFMGSALAYAFTASPWAALLIFLALGLGLALPFLVIGYVPALARRLPRPGAWMETLKQFLAFPMYLTAAWLAWVLGNQRGIDAVGYVLVGAIVLALGLWLREHGRSRGLAVRALAALVLLAALVPLTRIDALAPASSTTASRAEPYSAQRLAELRAQGRGVFVDMGADWCVTCKVNERAVLHTDAFRDLLARSNSVLMTGDWTNADPAISAFLKEYKAVGVPLYVVFRPAEDGPGQVLPTLLTHRIVADALAPR